jgi:23S rRNA pseudouridine2605 synthase
MSEERLQKILARAGVASRRHVEEMIAEGRVTINGRVAELGDKADAEADAIKVDGKRVAIEGRDQLYLLLNKPKGVMSTVSDPEGRRTVIDLVPKGMRKALVPVGRLDFQTEGLILLTTDGEFAHHVSHPRYGCTKVYEVKVSGRPDESQLDRLRTGIVLEGKKTAPCRIEPHALHGQETDGENSWWHVELSEGRTRQIREMFVRIGNPVRKLRRVGIGSLFDYSLPVGALRELSPAEVERLRKETRKVQAPGAMKSRAPAAARVRAAAKKAGILPAASRPRPTAKRASSRASSARRQAGEAAAEAAVAAVPRSLAKPKPKPKPRRPGQAGPRPSRPKLDPAPPRRKPSSRRPSR